MRNSPGPLASISSPRRYEPIGMTTRLPIVTGNEVCRYTESPGLALRVVIPFWRTTPMRVPAGTMTFSPEPARTGAGFGRTGEAAVCGPGGSCADNRPEEEIAIRKQAAPIAGKCLLVMGAPCYHRLRCESSE